MRVLLVAFVCLASVVAGAQELWLKISLQGNKLGYAAYSRVLENGGYRSESTMVLNSKILGTALAMRMSTITWADAKGNPLRSETITQSAGRQQVLKAKFLTDGIQIDLDNNGQKSRKTLPLPKDGSVIDDPTQMVLAGTLPLDKPIKIYILDPTTVALVPNEVVYKGKGTTTFGGKTVESHIIEVRDPRATTTLYVSAKGDLIHAVGPMGMTMQPTDRDDAIAENTEKGGVLDLALATALVPSKPLERPLATKKLQLTISGVDLRGIPSDGHQTVKKVEEGWQITVHPVSRNPKPSTLSAAGKAQPDWLKPDLHVPSQSPTFRSLAKKIVGDAKDVLTASGRIKAHVLKMMRPNAGIGVLRDASEVLETKEGVCRDYAILTATLCRAAGIPTKLASGLVSLDGRFYYHAWVEVWDGNAWYAVDSTRSEPNVSATHIKLAGGTVGETFIFKVLDGAKLRIDSVQY